jgi:hypothetical protein
MLSARTVRTLRTLRGHISKHDAKATDLECEVNKARVYENNQYGLHWTLSQAESLHDECTVTPAISLHGELLDPWIPPTPTYHNWYAIIIVVTAFIAIEEATRAIVRDPYRLVDN